MEKNLTTGSVFKNVIFFSLPYLLSYFLQTLYGMADLFIIGQFEGVASTTAVSIGLTGHAYADGYDRRACDGNDRQLSGRPSVRENRRQAALHIGNTVTLFMAVSVALTVVLLVLCPPDRCGHVHAGGSSGRNRPHT